MPDIENMIPAVQASAPEPDVRFSSFSPSSPLPAAASSRSPVAASSASAECPAEGREKYPNRFKPGQSGNPSGRPKKTDEEKEVIEQLKALAPTAVAAAKKILEGERVAAVAKVQVISLILAYAIGRPESTLKLTAAPQQSIEATEARVEALIRGIRIDGGVPQTPPTDPFADPSADSPSAPPAGGIDLVPPSAPPESDASGVLLSPDELLEDITGEDDPG